MCLASGVGRATFIRELLVSMQEHIDSLAQAVELAKQNNVDAFSKIASTLREVGSDYEQLQLDIKRSHRRAMRKRNS